MKEKLFIRLNRRIKRFLLNLATKYIRHCAKDSNYIKYALDEFKIAYNDWEKEEMQNLMCNQILDLLALLSTQGDSGFSYRYKIERFKRLSSFTPLTKLTFEDDEFESAHNEYSLYDSKKSTIRQNKRDSKYFLHSDGSIGYLNSITKRISHYIGKDMIIKKSSGEKYYGSVILVLDELSNLPVSYDIRVKDKHYPNDTITLDCYEIEYPDEWFVILCSSKEFDKVREKYEVKINDDDFSSELNFEGGIHKDEIIKRINVIKEHMYAES